MEPRGRERQTKRCRQVRSATIHYSLLRIAHHVQHFVQKQDQFRTRRLSALLIFISSMNRNALEVGLEQKAKEFKEAGADVYAKA